MWTQPVPAGPATAPAPPARAPGKRRIVGVDTARGLAIIGMFIAHLGLQRTTDLVSTTGWFWIADGRPSALFATLAGAGLAFMTAKAFASGDPGEYRTQRVRLAKRAAVLLVLGWVLAWLGTPVAVILGPYAVIFVMMMPFLRLRPGQLLAIAGAVAAVMPTLVLLSRYAAFGATSPQVYGGDPAAQLAMIVPVLADLWAGYYPALSWILYALVGLAVGRMQLGRWQTQLGLLVAGVVVAVTGYLPGALLERTTSGLAQDLVTIEPHSGTVFEMVGNVGVALGVLGLCLLLTTAIAPIRILLTPVSAMGAMSLSVYTAHLVVIRVYQSLWGLDVVFNPSSNWPLIGLTLGSMAFATIWQLTLGQGPLERLLHRITRPPQPPGPPSWHGHPGQQVWAAQAPWQGQPHQPSHQQPSPFQPQPPWPQQPPTTGQGYPAAPPPR